MLSSTAIPAVRRRLRARKSTTRGPARRTPATRGSPMARATPAMNPLEGGACCSPPSLDAVAESDMSISLRPARGPGALGPLGGGVGAENLIGGLTQQVCTPNEVLGTHRATHS